MFLDLQLHFLYIIIFIVIRVPILFSFLLQFKVALQHFFELFVHRFVLGVCFTRISFYFCFIFSYLRIFYINLLLQLLHLLLNGYSAKIKVFIHLFAGCRVHKSLVILIYYSACLKLPLLYLFLQCAIFFFKIPDFCTKIVIAFLNLVYLIFHYINLVPECIAEISLTLVKVLLNMYD